MNTLRFFITFFALFFQCALAEFEPSSKFMVPFGGPNHRQCFSEKTAECSTKAYKDNNYCVTNIKQSMESIKDYKWDPVINVQYTEKFVEYLHSCTFKETKKLVTAQSATPYFVPLPNFDEKALTQSGSNLKIHHQMCIESKIEKCIFDIPCYMNLQEKAVYYIVNTCSNEAFKKLNVSLEGHLIAKKFQL